MKIIKAIEGLGIPSNEMGYDFLLKCVMLIKSGYCIVPNASSTLKVYIFNSY